MFASCELDDFAYDLRLIRPRHADLSGDFDIDSELTWNATYSNLIGPRHPPHSPDSGSQAWRRRTFRSVRVMNPIPLHTPDFLSAGHTHWFG